MEEDDKFLLVLFENKKMTFREVSPSHIPNPNRAQTILAELIKKKLIQQETKKWKRGQKKIYSLTEKGKKEVLQITVRNVSKGLQDIVRFTSTLAESEEMQEYYTNLSESFFSKVYDAITDPEKLPKMSLSLYDDFYGETIKICANIHKIHCNSNKFKDYDSYVTISGPNSAHLINAKIVDILKVQMVDFQCRLSPEMTLQFEKGINKLYSELWPKLKS